MEEIIFVYILTVMGSIALGLSAIKSWFNIKMTAKTRVTLGNLSARVSKLEHAFKNLDFETEGLNLSGVDLSNILNQFGIDESILQNPVVRGLIAKLGSKLETKKENEPQINFEE